IGLGTAVVTLPIDDPLRAAEDAAVVDALSGGRVQLGIAAGGTPSSFPPLGRDPPARRQLFARPPAVLRDALAGRGVRGTESRIYPDAGDLGQRVWQATFSEGGGRRAGADGDGLLLSRTQPRPEGEHEAPLHEMQLPIIEAYLEELPEGVAPRILASRTALAVDPENLSRSEERRVGKEGRPGCAGVQLGENDASEAAGRQGAEAWKFHRARTSGVRFFFSSRRRHTRSKRDWSSDVCSSDLGRARGAAARNAAAHHRGLPRGAARGGGPAHPGLPHRPRRGPREPV